MTVRFDRATWKANNEHGSHLVGVGTYEANANWQAVGFYREQQPLKERFQMDRLRRQPTRRPVEFCRRRFVADATERVPKSTHLLRTRGTNHSIYPV